MSFLRTSSIRVAPFASRTPVSVRCLTTTRPAWKTAGETVEEINKKTGEAAARGLEKGQQAVESVKSSLGMGTSEASGKTSEMAGEAKGKAQEMMGEGKGSASEMAGEAQGKASEMAGQAKGKAQEVKGEVKSKM